MGLGAPAGCGARLPGCATESCILAWDAPSLQEGPPQPREPGGAGWAGGCTPGAAACVRDDKYLWVVDVLSIGGMGGGC